MQFLYSIFFILASEVLQRCCLFRKVGERDKDDGNRGQQWLGIHCLSLTFRTSGKILFVRRRWKLLVKRIWKLLPFYIRINIQKYVLMKITSIMHLKLMQSSIKRNNSYAFFSWIGWPPTAWWNTVINKEHEQNIVMAASNNGLF